jgi:hypothetical protein
MRRFRDGPPWWIDPYLRALGARELHALDVSDYEGADVIHDLNEPVPPELHDRFDVVFDGGSIEHVFDVKTVFRNYMSMVRPGGRLIVLTMANNHLGHGLYQLSPELFYRVLSEENGYEVERLQLSLEDVEYTRPVGGLRLPTDVGGAPARYDVVDPDEVGERVLLRNERGVTLLVQARRTRAVAPLARPPQQSDYTALWQGPASRAEAASPRADGIRALFRRHAGGAVQMVVALDLLPRLRALIDPLQRCRVARARSFGNRRFYRRAG